MWIPCPRSGSVSCGWDSSAHGRVVDNQADSCLVNIYEISHYLGSNGIVHPFVGAYLCTETTLCISCSVTAFTVPSKPSFPLSKQQPKTSQTLHAIRPIVSLAGRRTFPQSPALECCSKSPADVLVRSPGCFESFVQGLEELLLVGFNCHGRCDAHWPCQSLQM